MTGIDIPAFIDAYGLAGLIILGLMWTVRALWQRLNVQTDARLDDHKAHAAQMSDNTRSLERALDVV